MAIERAKNSHIWQRDAHDWYVEPKECSAALLKKELFEGKTWDPACGLGNILSSCQENGLEWIGSDIVKRSDFCLEERDFLTSRLELDFKNIISNPPFSIAEDFVRHAIEITPDNGKIAMILPLVWMAGFSKKRDWLPKSPLKAVFPISPRPSMPPGAVITAGVRPGNGTKDFAWFLWQKSYVGKPIIEFLDTSIIRREKRLQLKDDINESKKQWNFAL